MNDDILITESCDKFLILTLEIDKYFENFLLNSVLIVEISPTFLIISFHILFI